MPAVVQGEAYTGGVLCLLPQQGLLFTPLDLGRDFNAQLPFQVRQPCISVFVSALALNSLPLATAVQIRQRDAIGKAEGA